MIKRIFKVTSNILTKDFAIIASRFRPLLTSKPMLFFCQQKLDAIMQKVRSGIDDALLKEISDLNEDVQEKTIRSIVEGVSKKQLSPIVFATSKMADLSKKFPELYVQILSIRIALTEGQLVQKMKKGEITSQTVMPYLQTFSTSVAEWTASVPKIKKPMTAFRSGVLLNRTSNYIFQNYFSKYLLENKKEKGYRNICDWNKKVIKSIKLTIDDIVKSIDLLVQSKTAENEHQCLPAIKEHKQFLALVIDTFAYNLLCSHKGREEIFKATKNFEQYKKELMEIRDNILFLLPYYDKLGIDDLTFFTQRFIEMKRLNAIFSVFLNQKFQTETMTIEEEKNIKTMMADHLGKMVEETIESFRKIKNKEDNPNKIMNCAINIMAIRVEQLGQKSIGYEELQREMKRYKEEIVREVPENMRRNVEERLEVGIKGNLKLKQEKQIKPEIHGENCSCSHIH